MDTKKSEKGNAESDWIHSNEPVSEDDNSSVMSFGSDSSKEWTVDPTLTVSKVEAVNGKTVGQTRFMNAIRSIEKRAMEQEERKKEMKERKKEKKERKASVKPTSGR